MLITGATSGIGEATAICLAKEGHQLAISGRRVVKLQALQKTLLALGSPAVLLLPVDLRNDEQLQSVIENLLEKWGQIDVLINNAGLSLGFEPFYEGKLEDWDNVMNTNVRALLLISKLVANVMIAKGSGQIVNVSSIAGTQVYANGNVYCASKHAVDALTKAMRIDLLAHGIRVSSVSPGAVNTAFSTIRFKGDEQRANQVYEGYQPLLAEDIAASILHIINSPAHVNINDIEITPTAQANAYYLHKTVAK